VLSMVERTKTEVPTGEMELADRVDSAHKWGGAAELDGLEPLGEAAGSGAAGVKRPG
jgi:hypothetical protein